jgi:Domain of unknown function (DUF6702)
MASWAKRWSRHAALVVVGLASPGAQRADAHPLHTTFTELSTDPSAHDVSVLLRLFAGDLASAVTARASAGSPDRMPPDSAMIRYVFERFEITANGVGRVPLTWCGSRRDRDVMFLCFHARAASLSQARLRNTLLNEIFADEVNVVRVNIYGRRETLLFTGRDVMKTLP